MQIASLAVAGKMRRGTGETRISFRRGFYAGPSCSIMIGMSRSVNTPVLERMLEPVTRCLNVEAATKLVRLKADARVQARVARLARKCNEGELTPEEMAEYDRYIAFADFVAILQAQARLLLARKS
ncbi:MAG TPA: hypothetical protein VMR25_02740 [Planctomycetaceae bacterium]|nr:hypothetical protein [Planctomycetaceae bacterium]